MNRYFLAWAFSMFFILMWSASLFVFMVFPEYGRGAYSVSKKIESYVESICTKLN
jgi:hypothetical protein